MACLVLVGFVTAGASAQAQSDAVTDEAIGPALDVEIDPATDAVIERAADDESGPLLVVVPHRDSIVVSQLLAVELTTMGFQSQPRRECDRAALEREIEAGTISAALCVQKDEFGSDLVLLLLPGGQTLTSSRPDDLEPRVFTLRIAEQARTALLLETSASPKPKDAPSQDEDVPRRVLPETSNSPTKGRDFSFEFALGAAVEGGPGGLGVAARGWGHVAWWPGKSLGVSGIVLFPLHPQTVAEDGASATVWSTSLAMGPSLRILPASWLQLDASLLLGGGIVTMSGDAPPPRPVSTETVFPLLIGGGLGMNVSLTKCIFSRLEGALLANAPAVEVRFGGESVAERAFQVAMGLEVGIVLP